MFIPWWGVIIIFAVVIWALTHRHSDHNAIAALQERVDALESRTQALDDKFDDLEEERWAGFDELHPKS